MSNAEMDTLRVGSVVRTRHGGFRVVREVHRAPPHNVGYLPKLYVVFAIKHRSWTGRPYTVLTRSDLRYCGYVPTPARVSLRTRMDRRLAEAIRTGNRSLTYEDVRGLP